MGDAGGNAIAGDQWPPDVLAEISESCSQLLNALPDGTMKTIVLLKFQGAKNGDVAGDVADDLNCTRRTIERKLERIRRIWVEAGLHDGAQLSAGGSL